jgi:peptidoglycan hydrolase-like protein with peptidoglycan-binding domain
MNKELGAQAFAHGSDIYYGAGKSPAKDELTAHELTHTIQQGGAVPTKSVTGHQKKENKLEAKADAIEANKDKSAVGMPQKQKSVPDATTEAFSAIPASSDETLQQPNTISDLSANQTIDGLAAPAKDGKPLVKEDSKNDDFTNNNKQASKGDDKSRGGDFQENLISSTIYLPGESFIIQVPASLIVDPSRSSFEIQVKTLVQGFGFEENDAREIIQDLSQRGLSTGINLVGVVYSVFSRPDGQRSVSVNMSTDKANSYRQEAANRRQRKLDQGKEQQRIDSARKQQLSKQYVSVLQKYDIQIRNRLRELFNSLTPTDRELINTQTKEIYTEIAGSNSNVELLEAIRIGVMNRLHPDKVQYITSGKASAREEYISLLRRLYNQDIITQLNRYINNDLRKDYKTSLDKTVKEIYGKIAANSWDRELYEAIQILVFSERFPINVQNILNPKAPPQNTGDRRAIPSHQNKNNPPRSSIPNNRGANQPRQPGPGINNDRTRWQATVTQFDRRFRANYSREQIIVIQGLVGASPDGTYGEETAQKVYQWQKNHRVPNPDGLVGDVTRRAMVAQLRGTNPAAADILSQEKAPPPRTEAATNLESNRTDSRAQLEAFPPAIKTLLGRPETFQTENYPQLLRVGNKLRQLPPEEFKYIYQPFASNLAGDLTGLERSIDIFTSTRSQVIAGLQSPERTYLEQRVNSTLFGEKPLTSNSSWQQVLKDLIASVLQSPNHAPEILGEVFNFLKEHWVQFVGLTVALIAAQASVAALAGIPEPTFLSKVLAVALQGFILQDLRRHTICSVYTTTIVPRLTDQGRSATLRRSATLGRSLAELTS